MKFRHSLLITAVAGATLIVASPARAGHTTISQVSVSSTGILANDDSDTPAISANGQYIAFASEATNLVPDDTNQSWDVFLRDRRTGTTSRVSLSDTGAQAGAASRQPAISGDGRYVAFTSWARDLVPGDTRAGGPDVFVRDRRIGTTRRVSVSSDGTQGNNSSFAPVISADGRYVAFISGATNLVPDDTNGTEDLFVHDQRTGTTSRVSVATDDTQANAMISRPAISADGRYVSFESWATNLVPDDTNEVEDVFVHDLRTGITSRVSLAADGSEGNGRSADGSAISADGRYVTFGSWASNLVPDDTNGLFDVFVRDRRTGRTSLISGSIGCCGSFGPVISANGRYIVFNANAGGRHLFVHDRRAGTTSPVDSPDTGAWSGISYEPAISANGRHIAFTFKAGSPNPHITHPSQVFLWSNAH